jgi:hypothetical protein
MGLLSFFARFQGFTGIISRLPLWARLVLLLAALPGLAAVFISLLAMAVSLVILLVLAMPVLRVLGWITGAAMPSMPAYEQPPSDGPHRHIDVKIIEQ